MPEMKKYLNRDGLEEYNSLLPHSSGEMQKYVNDWLDEHPEATTTVQDGAITEPKLADKSVSLRTLADDTVHMLNGMILTREISGDILTADDAYSAPPVALTVDGKSTQDGTPTPESPVEIVSVEQVVLQFAGKNILDPSFLTRCGWTESNGQYTGTLKQLYQGLANHTLLVECAENTQYVFAWYQVSTTNTSNKNAASLRFIYSDGTQSAVKYSDLNPIFAFVSEEGKTVVGLNFSYVSNPTLVVKCVQLVPFALWDGEIVASYRPYAAPTTVTLPVTLRSLPDGTKDTLALSYLKPSTREGWAWYTRELVQKLTATDMQDLSITKSGNFYRVTQANMKLATENGQWILMCECLRYNNAVTKGWFEANEVNNAIRPIYGQSFKAYIRADAYATVTDLKAALAGNEVVYKLATPITTQLDPIELPVLPAPNCTVWSDPSTGLTMEYVRDSNLVIRRIEEAIADQ